MSDNRPHPFLGHWAPPQEPADRTMYQPQMSETQALREQIAELRKRIEHLELSYTFKRIDEADNKHLYQPTSP